MCSISSLPRPQAPSKPVAPTSSTGNTQSLNQVIYCAFWFRDRVMLSLTMSIRIFSYHTSNNTWNFVTSIPYLIENYCLKDFAMVSLGDSIYIIGGQLFRQQRAQSPSREETNNLPAEKVVASMWRYNLRSREWSTCASLAIPRYDFACTVCNNKIYVAGGKSTPTSPIGLASAEVYDPTRDVWALLPNMSTLRYKCAGVTWNGKIHVVGGFALKAGCDAKALNFTPERSSADVYDTQAGEWDLVSGMWQLDVPPNQIVTVNGRLLSSGDCLKVWKGHIEVYDWEQNIWNEVEGSRLPNLNWPISNPNCEANNRALVQQLYLTIAPIGTYLYVLAGYQVEGETPRTKSIVHRFDTSATSNAWVSFEPMEEEGEKVLCSHCCVAQLS